jgi:hypothetical protein
MAASAFGSYVQQATLKANDEIGLSDLGSAVALSEDGKTALVGGPQDGNGIGAAWIFVRKGAAWTEQDKLTGKGEIGVGGFGTSVALSSDGRTALIGAPRDNGGLGAAWVFTRSGANWRQRGAKFIGKDAGGAQQEAHCDSIGTEYAGGSGTYCFVGHPADFGESVALASDGDTALIGGPGDNENDGAVWVFTRSGSKWTQQGEKLTGGGEQNEFFSDGGYFVERTGGRFGASVALSSDDRTALIGGPRDDGFYYGGGGYLSGAAWTFTRTDSTWTQQGEKLVGPGGLGAATALSRNGNTALMGGSEDNVVNPSTAAVFTRSGSTWTQQSTLWRGNGPEYGGFPRVRVALSSDASTALISARREGNPEGFEEQAARVFRGSGTTWIEQAPTLHVPEGTCGFMPGYGETGVCDVALSADASTALFGTVVYVDRP